MIKGRRILDFEKHPNDRHYHIVPLQMGRPRPQVPHDGAVPPPGLPAPAPHTTTPEIPLNLAPSTI